jgi:FHS family L-fucose permease-like MFS transporter
MVGLGFVVSVFFPTLYAMALERTVIAPEKASGILTFGFLGCAVFPVLQGRLADTYGLKTSYALGLFVYVAAFMYVVFVLRASSTKSESRM